MRNLAAFLLAILLTLPARAAEPWLKPNDIVALVGGEDMVTLAEEGWLETIVTSAQPQDHIRFRSIAWEGDTVFEQRRDLNYPMLEAQLDKMGATVVICQFGKMESFAGKDGVAAFSEAYEKLIDRLSGEKKRRIALVLPMRFAAPPKAARDLPDLTPRNADLTAYEQAITALAAKNTALILDANYLGEDASKEEYPTRDGIHLLIRDSVAAEHIELAECLSVGLGIVAEFGKKAKTGDTVIPGEVMALRHLISAKNRLWFHYTRPQNWAFLAGNRTNQPSSRDHLDPTKRWFPAEMAQWIPLIEAKEREIQNLVDEQR